MKKELLKFSDVRIVKRMSPKFSSRRFPSGMRFASSSYKSDGGDDDEEQKELLEKIKKTVEKQLEGRAKKEDIQKITEQLSFLTRTKNEKGEVVESEFPIEALRAMADDKTGVMAKLVEMGTKIQEQETRIANQVKDMSVRSQVEAWHKANAETLKAISEGQKRELPVMEIRAASPMLVSTVDSGNSPYIGRTEVESGINGILVYPNKFWDFLQKGRTGSPTYVWVNKTNREGSAAFIGPGVAKPGVSFELVAETSNAKKIAVSAKAGTELLQDIDGMTTFIEQELKEMLYIEVNSKLMTGVSSSTVPAGIQTLSQAFAFYTDAAANIKTTNPNYMDAMRAVVAALRSGKLVGEVTLYVNSIDAANMDLSKATDSGVYLLPPFTTSSGQVIAGAKVIEDQNIPVGSFQAGFMRYYRVLIYKDYTVSWGWENDDFTKNLVTAVGETRLHQFFNSIHTGAFCFDTFENVITAITKA